MESAVHSSLHEKCHHQIIYVKLNLKIHYPPPYERQIWHCNYTNTDLIQRAINMQQCSLIGNSSEIPASLNLKITKTLSSIPVTRAEFAKIIKNLDPNKAHGHDMISIRMLKLCGDPV